jgi:sigma-E factor negative regulatory protein RseC
MSEKIEYRGIITAVRPGIIQVEILDETACAACAAQKSCCMSGRREKRIEIPFTSGDYHPSDKVIVTGNSSMELKAVFFAFILPLILILTALFTAFSMKMDERQAAVISLSILTIYFIGVYFFRNKFKKNFTFALKL